MKKQTFSILLTFLLIATFASAQSISVKSQSETNLEVQQSSFNRIDFKNTLSAIEHIRSISIDDKNFIKLQIPTYVSSASIGEPALPVKTEIIEIPYGSRIRIKINKKEQEEISLKNLGYTHAIVPAQAPVSKSSTRPPVLQYKENFYKKNSYTDVPLVSVEYLGEMRGVQYARITIAPVQYNPLKNTLRIYHTLDFSLLFENGDEATTMQRKQIYASPEFKGIGGRAINNLSTVSTYSTIPNLKKSDDYQALASGVLRYVIISDTMFAEALEPFIAWKKQQGFDVLVGYTSNPTVGKTTDQIRAYLKNLYDKASIYAPAPSYILLVGDVAQVPAFNSILPKSPNNYYATDHVTDLYYAEYTGDYLPDAYYGRFSASTVEQLLPQIEKTLKMEQLNLPSDKFMDTSVFISGYDKYWGNRVLNKATSYAVQNYFNPEHGVNTKLYLSPSSSSKAEDIIADINQGACVVSYSAHGVWDRWSDPELSVQDVRTKLSNTDKYPLMIGNCCLTGKFEKGECFGEALLRADKKGAVAYIGASNSSYFVEDFYWQVGVAEQYLDTGDITYENTGLGVYDKLFHTRGENVNQWIITTADMITEGNLTVMEVPSLVHHYYWEIYHVFGDPSYRIHVRNPDSVKVEHPKTTTLNTKEMEVKTQAYAGISLHQGDRIVSYALADSLGNARLPMQLTTTDALTIRVWAQFKRDYVRDIPLVSPEGAYVFVFDKTIKNKDNVEQTNVIYSDTYTVDLTLKNVGQSAANNAKVELMAIDNDVQILTAESDVIPSMDPNATIQIADKLKFKVNPNIKDSLPMYVKVRVSFQGQEPSEQLLFLLASAPKLEFVDVRIEDAQARNPNGKLDPAENVTVHLRFRNVGSQTLRDGSITISSPESYIVPSQTPISIGNLESGQEKTISFPLGATDQALAYSLYTVNVNARSLEREETFSFKESISVLLEDFETGNFTRMPWDTLASTWLIANGEGFEGNYSAMSARIGRNDSTHLIIRSEVLRDDTIYFHYKVSSELRENIYGDFLQFFINDELMLSKAGAIPWTKVGFAVKQGSNTFRWTYMKDDSDEEYQDRAWIDNISFPLGTGGVTSIEDGLTEMESENSFKVFMNKSGEIELTFTLQNTLQGNLYLVDLRGRKVAVLGQNIRIEAGSTSLQYQAPKLPKSLYFCVFETTQERMTQKFISM